MHSRFRFYALIALIGLANSAIAQEGPEAPQALSQPTPGKHQLKPTPMQVLEHLIVQQNQQITEQKEQITSLVAKVEAQDKTLSDLLTKVDTSRAQIETLGGQLIQITDLLEEVRKAVNSPGVAPVAPAAAGAPAGADPLDETAEVTTARISAQAPQPPVDATAIPVPATAPGADGAATGKRVHVVAPGETLGIIARQYGTSVQELLKLNNMKDPRKLRAGQDLVIP